LPYRFFERSADGTERDITEELPFEIPETWEWVRIGSVFNLQAGKFVQAQDIHSEYKNFFPCYGGNGLRGYVDRYNRDGRFQLIGRQGALCGNINYAEGQFYATEHAVVVEYFCDVNVHWIGYFLTALNLNQYSTATAQPGLAVANINKVLIPLPPLTEQQRIAERTAQLLPHITDYDTVTQKLNALNMMFPEQLKKSILQAAVQGKLVPQDPNDEPASVLLERIRIEREQLIREGKIKRNKNESIIFKRDNSNYEMRDGVEVCIDDELPFEIPESWIWCRLGNIGTFVRGSGIKRSDILASGVYCVRYGELYTTYDISMTNTISFVSEALAEKSKSITHGDLLFTLTGEKKEEIGKAVAFMGYEKTVIGGDLAIFTDHTQNPLYLSYFMSSPCAIRQKTMLGTGNIIVHISCEKLSSILIPIPPYAEQHRIVEKIDTLMPICNNL